MIIQSDTFLTGDTNCKYSRFSDQCSVRRYFFFVVFICLSVFFLVCFIPRKDGKRRNDEDIKKERVPTFLIPLDGSGKPYQKNEEKRTARWSYLLSCLAWRESKGFPLDGNGM